MNDELEHFLKGNFDYFLDFYRESVGINSFTENADGVDQLGHKTINEFSKLGFVAETIPAENPECGQHVFLRAQGKSKKSVLFVSHLDTVFSSEEEQLNNFHWNLSGDKVYGPGTCDIKGGTVVILMVLTALKEKCPDFFERFSWIVALNSAEEQASMDFVTHCLAQDISEIQAALVFEAETFADGKTQLVVGRKGLSCFVAEVYGRGAHAGLRHRDGLNAIEQLSHIVTKIQKLTDYKKNITANVGQIEGGSVFNRVPHYAKAIFEIRAFSPELLKEAIAAVKDLENSSDVQNIDSGDKCKISIEHWRGLPAWPENEKTKLLHNKFVEAGKKLGMDVVAMCRGGGSDGNGLWESIPTIDGLGPVGFNAHCSENNPEQNKEQEYALLSSFIPKTMLTIEALQLILESADST